jgi:hypothetical protein
MPLVKFRKKFRIFSFDFLQNFDVRKFSRWLSIRGTKREISTKIFLQKVNCSPISIRGMDFIAG